MNFMLYNPVILVVRNRPKKRMSKNLKNKKPKKVQSIKRDKVSRERLRKKMTRVLMTGRE